MGEEGDFAEHAQLRRGLPLLWWENPQSCDPRAAPKLPVIKTCGLGARIARKQENGCASLPRGKAVEGQLQDQPERVTPLLCSVSLCAVTIKLIGLTSGINISVPSTR